MKWWRGMRTQKSMVQWCKARYHEAFKEYKLNTRCFPADGPAIAADVATVGVWREILYYLTEDDEWLQ
jgi:hypothetical protein